MVEGRGQEVSVSYKELGLGLPQNQLKIHEQTTSRASEAILDESIRNSKSLTVMPTLNDTDRNNNSSNKLPSMVSAVEIAIPGMTQLIPSNHSNGDQQHEESFEVQQRQATSILKSPQPDNQQAYNNHQQNNNIINHSNNNNNNNHSQLNQLQHLNHISQHHQEQQHQHQQYRNQHHQNYPQPQIPRSPEVLMQLIKDVDFDRTSLSNEELIKLVKNQQISIYKLESFLGKNNADRCVQVRRDFYRLELAELDKIDQYGTRDRAEAFNSHPSYEDLDYEKVNGACCENVIGHVKIPVGLAGPLVLDGEEIFVPLATTEGCLVASTCRGLSALRKSGGVCSRVRRDFMTRAPIIRFQDLKLRDALDNVERAIAWLNDKDNKEKMRSAFNLTSSHGRFQNYTIYPVNREIHIRFEAQTGDAMGMNMCSKGVENALKEMQRAFPTMEIVTLSGNMCTDKKAAGINWINGRGKSVECNAELPAHVVQQVFKVSVDSMIDRWKSKVMIGSALAASIGGFNSQAANILTAIYIATGQDPAQNVTSSNCMLILEKDSKGSLVVCCTMPSIECGTVGGGTILADQSRYLQMMGVKGPTSKRQFNNHIRQQQQQQRAGEMIETIRENGDHKSNNVNNTFIDNYPTSSDKSLRAQITSLSSSMTVSVNNDTYNTQINSVNEHTNARKLARIICATVMAGELSLLAALTEGTLVKSHMRHNRSSTNVTTSSLANNNLATNNNKYQNYHNNHSPPCFGLSNNNNNNYNINNQAIASPNGGDNYNNNHHNHHNHINNNNSIVSNYREFSNIDNHFNDYNYHNNYHHNNHNHNIIQANSQMNSTLAGDCDDRGSRAVGRSLGGCGPSAGSGGGGGGSPCGGGDIC